MPTKAHWVLHSRERPALHQRNGECARWCDDFRTPTRFHPPHAKRSLPYVALLPPRVRLTAFSTHAGESIRSTLLRLHAFRRKPIAAQLSRLPWTREPGSLAAYREWREGT